MEKKENTGFISLKEAAQICNYSQEYLSLRVRQGKIKAKKIGRNWVTTNEWIEKYRNEIKGLKKEETKQEDDVRQGTVKWVEAPRNLPVEEFVSEEDGGGIRPVMRPGALSYGKAFS